MDALNSSELLALLEKEASDQILQNDSLEAVTESNVELSLVREWFFETEKLIRVLANILPSSMAQPINQLRYAGHHLLKSFSSDSLDKTNLLEAYKHCKRAYYDALDLYVYHLSAAFRDKLAFLPGEKSKPLAKKITEHLKDIQDARFKCETRVEYYSLIQVSLIEGLGFIEEVNTSLYAAGVTTEVLNERKDLVKENAALKEQISTKLDAAQRKFNYWMLLITATIVLATMLGLVFEGYGTQRFVDSRHIISVNSMPENKTEHPINIELSPTINIDSQQSERKEVKN